MALPKGKYFRVQQGKPSAFGICDNTGALVNYTDLVKQYEYAGSGLVWTGLWVAKQFADKPQPQLLYPKIKADPYPLLHPRPDIPKWKA